MIGGRLLGRLPDRYGFRGAWLIVLGVVWGVFALTTLADVRPARPWVLIEYLPAWVNALAWAATGAIAVIVGMRGPATPASPDGLGFAALWVLPAVRVFCFGLSWLAWLGSSALHAIWPRVDVVGWSGGWYAVLLWGLISVMLRLVETWPNPVQPIPYPPAGVAERP